MISSIDSRIWQEKHSNNALNYFSRDPYFEGLELTGMLFRRIGHRKFIERVDAWDNYLEWLEEAKKNRSNPILKMDLKRFFFVIFYSK